ncbi:hypothetical protein CJ030_MR8G028971 [Morella rubra]|uniref:Uncharacterized protein n=1 Tax=Morella rubra TaxID=262757 RepID=A0A6A1UQ58_9ROSI|nr:hypothetical protein CJ030_MR8G028971 [Morella rubra]
MTLSMNRLKSRKCRRWNFSMNNARILAPEIKKTKIKLLNRQITLIVICNFQLQLKLSGTIILMINAPKIVPHLLGSSKTTKIGHEMRLK